MAFLNDLMAFFKARKKFWLIPLMGLFLTFGAIFVLAQGSVVAPFIYTLF